MWSGMVQFPMLVPPTVDHSDDWLIVLGDENQLAQEEAELEEKVRRVAEFAILCLHYVCDDDVVDAFRCVSGYAPGWRSLEKFSKGPSVFLDLV